MLVCVTAVTLFAAEKGKTDFRTYPLHTPRAEATTTIEMIRELIRKDLKIFHIKRTNELIISATEQEHEQIAGLLKKVNVPAPNIRLDVIFRVQGEETEGGLGVRGGGRVMITPDSTRSKVKFKGHVKNRTATMSSTTQQTLVTQSGVEASLTISEQVPFYEWLFAFGLQWGLIKRDMVMKEVGAFLVARPEVVGKGPMISVTLVPELRGLVGERRHRIQFTRVSTTVVVQDGKTIAIGGYGNSKEFYEKFLVGVDAGGKSRKLTITLTPRMLNPDGTPVNP
jgi:type II secretory pathway component GspD/PulD (secretin)